MRIVLVAGLLFWAGCGDNPAIVVQTLEVVSWEPDQGAQCVSVDPATFAARVTFSDDIDAGTLDGTTLFIRNDQGNPEPTTLVYDSFTQTATLSIASDLQYGAIYDIVATADVAGLSQGRLGVERTSSFRTIVGAGCL